METLFITKSFDGVFYLMDSKKNLIGRFNTLEAAQNWAKENGYKVRIN